jgi:hypothetical protein
MASEKKSPVLKTAVLGLGRIAWSFHIPQIISHPTRCRINGFMDCWIIGFEFKTIQQSNNP